MSYNAFGTGQRRQERSRFKSVLGAYPDQRQRWFSFKNARRRARMEAWLEDEGIEYEFV